MRRLVWPNAFILYSAELPEVENRTTAVVREVLRKVYRGYKTLDKYSTPAALRWATTPLIGFPRQPFRVYRRRAGGFKFENLVDGTTAVNGVRRLDWGQREMYSVRFQAAVTGGNAMNIVALDRNDEVIPGQRITVTAGTACMFKCPGIASLRCVGAGSITNVQGADQAVLANDGGWELIEVVGLPFKAGETTLP